MSSTEEISSFRILHIIGFSGAGKSTFIRQYFHEYPAFDIQALYKELQVDPSQLQGNPEIFRKFRDALSYHFTQFITNVVTNQSPFAIVESSGINLALNSLLERYSLYTIWIDLGKPFPYDELFVEERPWAKELNTELENLWLKHEITADNEFNMQTGQFSHPIPNEFKDFFQSLRITKKSKDEPKSSSGRIKSGVNLSSVSMLKDNRYVCPSCQADFSKPEYLDKHFQRYPKCCSQ